MLQFYFSAWVISYYPAESLSWYSEALSKHACMPVSFHRRKMMSDSSLGMVPSSIVSARCMSFLASSCRVDARGQGHIQVRFSSLQKTCKKPIYTKHIKVFLSCRYLLIRVTKANIECVHGLHDGHDGLQGVAVDDGNELQAFFK